MTKPLPAVIAAPHSLFLHPSRNSSQKKASQTSLPAVLPAVLNAATMALATAVVQIVTLAHITTAVRNAVQTARCMMWFAMAVVQQHKYLSSRAATNLSTVVIALIATILANLPQENHRSLPNGRSFFVCWKHNLVKIRWMCS